MVKEISLSAQKAFLLEGPPVVMLTGNEFSKKEGVTLTQQVSEYGYIGVVVIRQYASGNKKLYVHEVFLKRKLLDGSSNPTQSLATNQGNIAKVLQKILSAKFE
jgi:hypothetical protein